MKCHCKISGGSCVVGLPDQLKPLFLSGLRDGELREILALAKHRRFPGSGVILHEGDPAERVFLLTSGHGRHFVTTPSGQKVLLYWLRAGQVFGGVALISSQIRYLASTELESSSCALMWERKDIRELIGRYPKLLDNALCAAATENFVWFVGAQVSLSSDDARGRIAHLLVSVANGIGAIGTDGIEVKVSNEDLAAGANVTPFTVSRCLSEWQRAGVLLKRRGRILLRKPHLLMTSNPVRRPSLADSASGEWPAAISQNAARVVALEQRRLRR